MSGRKERLKGNGVGIRSAKAGKVDEVVEKEKDAEEDEWNQGDDTDAGRRTVYNKNSWFLVEEWRNIDKEEALRRAAVIMIKDFQIAGGPILEYVAPTDRKIGPYGYRNVSVGLFLFIYTLDKEF